MTPGTCGSWDDYQVWRPMVLVTGSDYTMYYRGENAKQIAQTGIATSTDGIHWTRKSVLPPIAKGTWDANWNSPYSIIAVPGGYLMAYDGARSTSTSSNEYIGFASSVDGINFIPYPSNPVVAPNVAGISFDSLGVGEPMVVMVANEYYVYYYGWTSAVTGIGVAVLPGSQFPIQEFSFTQLMPAIVMLASAVVLLSTRRNLANR